MRGNSPWLLFVGLPLLSGLLMWSSWPPLPTALPVFIGLVPLFLADEAISARFRKFTGLKVWLAVYLGLLVWNVSTTWWVANASLIGGIFACMANPALMSVPFMAARRIRIRFGEQAGYLAFVSFWMSFEFIHLRWELTWPWLTLGNVFAAKYQWVQWYSYTGAFGGTFWVLLVNLLILSICKRTLYPERYPPHRRVGNLISGIALVLLCIMIPIGISLWQYAHYEDKGDPVQVTVLQPNFDPYTEKFTVPYRLQMDKMLEWSFKRVDDSTDFLLWPETAIQDDIWLDRLQTERPVRDIQKAIDSFPGLTCIIGINGFERFRNADEATATARKYILNQQGPGVPDTLLFDVYNTALALNHNGPVGYYHKSKLVPGVERMPYPEQLAWLNRLTIDLGGISGSLGIQKERTVFFNAQNVGVAPVICYESVFGEYVSDYVKKGAGIIGIITNDGWWGDTDGYKQHCMYASLRSIETRRSLARSANTGISCFIDQKGNITQATDWRTDAVITASLPVNTDLTFYTEHGDFLARIALWMSAAILIVAWGYRLRDRWMQGAAKRQHDK